MEYALLWVESLSLAILLALYVRSAAGRARKSWIRATCRCLAFAAPAIFGVFYTMVAWYFRQNGIQPDWFFAYSLSWLICFSVVFFLTGRFVAKVDIVPKAGESSARPNLLLAFCVVFVFLVATYMKIDMDVRARLASSQIQGLAAAMRVSPESENDAHSGGVLFRKALDSIDLPAWASKIDNSEYMPDMEDVESVLTNNRQTLELIRRAAEISEDSFVPGKLAYDRYWPSFHSELPDGHGTTEACLLLALDALYNTRKEEADAALADIGLIGDIAASFGRIPYLVSNMQTVRLVEVQKTALERFLASGQDFEPERVLDAVKRDSFLLDSFRRAIVMEEGMFLYSYSKDMSVARLSDIFYSNGGDLLDLGLCLFPYRAFMVRSELDFSDQYWKKHQEFVSLPIYRGFNRHEEWENDIMKHPGGIVSGIAFVKMSRYYVNPNVGEANQRLMLLAAALSACRDGNGFYPDRIGDLIPDYAAGLPIDPFDGEPLKIKSVDGGLIVYSVGPDFKDNGGETEYELPYDEKKSGDIVFRIGSAHSKLDSDRNL